MKAIVPIGCFVVAAILLATSNAHAVQVTYRVSQTGASGNLDFGAGESHPDFLNQIIDTDIARYQLTGSVNPDRVGLIGVSSGFRAAVAKELPGFTPEGGFLADGGQETDEVIPDPFGGSMFGWDRVTIDTSAVGRFETTARINGLSATNDVGYVKFDWVVTGISSILVDADQGFGDFEVVDAVSIAKLDSSTETVDSFIHAPSVGPDDSVNDTKPGVLQQESFFVPYDFTQLDSGEVPLIGVDFEFTVATRLDVTNTDGGGFVGIFDANFSNTATLTSVTVFDSNDNVLDASVVDAFSGQSLVSSSVPEPSAVIVLLLAGCAGAIGRRRIS